MSMSQHQENLAIVDAAKCAIFRAIVKAMDVAEPSAKISTQESLAYDLLVSKTFPEADSTCGKNHPESVDSESTAEPESQSVCLSTADGGSVAASPLSRTSSLLAPSGQALDAAALPTKDSVVYLKNVNVFTPNEDPRIDELVRQTRDLSMKVFYEDGLKDVTKKSGWKLFILASEDLSMLCGFVISKVISGALSVGKVAVPSELRGRGFGSLVMSHVVKQAKAQGNNEVCLSSLPTSIKFYRNLGYKGFPGVKVESDSGHTHFPGQLYMVKKMPPQKKAGGGKK
jgi:ribosomal protein S18 acetylase RimI-like enzyme